MKSFSLVLLLIFATTVSLLPAEDRFASDWRGREVYLLIPRHQGKKRGFLKTTHFEFTVGRPDSYKRQVSSLHDELFFELFKVQSAKCDRRECRVHLSRPVLPGEDVLGPRVAVVLAIKGESKISPEEANRMLLTAIIEKDMFPPLLRAGEGPYGRVAPFIDLSTLLQTALPTPGMTAQQVEQALGKPLDIRRSSFGKREFQYWWYLGYRLFVLFEGNSVVRACVLYF